MLTIIIVLAVLAAASVVCLAIIEHQSYKLTKQYNSLVHRYELQRLRLEAEQEHSDWRAARLYEQRRLNRALRLAGQADIDERDETIENMSLALELLNSEHDRVVSQLDDLTIAYVRTTMGAEPVEVPKVKQPWTPPSFVRDTDDDIDIPIGYYAMDQA